MNADTNQPRCTDVMSSPLARPDTVGGGLSNTGECQREHRRNPLRSDRDDFLRNHEQTARLSIAGISGQRAGPAVQSNAATKSEISSGEAPRGRDARP